MNDLIFTLQILFVDVKSIFYPKNELGLILQIVDFISFSRYSLMILVLLFPFSVEISIK